MLNKMVRLWIIVKLNLKFVHTADGMGDETDINDKALDEILIHCESMIGV